MKTRKTQKRRTRLTSQLPWMRRTRAKRVKIIGRTLSHFSAEMAGTPKVLDPDGILTALLTNALYYCDENNVDFLYCVRRALRMYDWFNEHGLR